MKKTILIVDDFENTRKVIEFSLKKIEHNALMAENGEEALGLFDGREIDLLITDLNMPGLRSAIINAPCPPMEWPEITASSEIGK